MSIVTDQETPETTTPPPTAPGQALSTWVMAKVDAWRTHRDTQHKERWDEYYRLWRAQFSENDKTRKSERSKLVAPATMQAVDSTIAEIEEAVFGREQWIDVRQDVVEAKDPEQRSKLLESRDRLLERLTQADVPSACSKAFLIGAVYGTGVGKINVEVIKRKGKPGEPTSEEVLVEVIPLEPYEFVPDPTTDDIDAMLGMAHETIVPLHKIRRGQKDGKYFQTNVSAWEGESPGDTKEDGLSLKLPQGLSAYITEYHGLVPAQYLARALAPAEDDEKLKLLFEGQDPEDELVEAIVTIANKGILIGAKANPFWQEDRSFIAYQHDTVPNYFWGRGVAEKGYQPQKALDAELRARIDTMAMISLPMVAGDVTRLPRGMNLGIWPGKFWPTTGNPGEILQPFTFGNLNPSTFNSTADLERMVQMATGAMDPTSAFSQNSSPTNNALNASAFIKRARRTMQNIERNWLEPMVQKVLLRYMQFDPQNFPEDPGFRVSGSLGMMARELEQQQLTQLASLVPNESAPFLVLLKAIFDNSSSPHKGEMVKAVDAMLAPPDEEAKQKQAALEQLQLRGQMATVAEAEGKAQKAAAEAQRARAQANLFAVEADLKDDEMVQVNIDQAINQREVAAFEMQNQISLMMQQLRAFDLALKAQQIQAQVQKTTAEARAIQRGTKEPAGG